MKRLDDIGLHVFACCLNKKSMADLASVCSNRLIPVLMDVTDDSSILQAHITVKKHLPPGKGILNFAQGMILLHIIDKMTQYTNTFYYFKK